MAAIIERDFQTVSVPAQLPAIRGTAEEMALCDPSVTQTTCRNALTHRFKAKKGLLLSSEKNPQSMAVSTKAGSCAHSHTGGPGPGCTLT